MENKMLREKLEFLIQEVEELKERVGVLETAYKLPKKNKFRSTLNWNPYAKKGEEGYMSDDD